ncbi:hypothetical protein KR093_004145, partial [Drosophila rubida]
FVAVLSMASRFPSRKAASHDRDDVFLKSLSMHRHQMPQDGTCLFRVVAEQMYDSQSLHFEVRMECVRFMTRKRRIFEKQINQDFDAYTRHMAQSRTRGTMVELRAMCLLYRRNMQLYQYKKPTMHITYNKSFTGHFTVYYTSNHHFDNVMTAEHYETAAAAQSICYKLILKQLLKLPDVELAVQRMLFPDTFKRAPLERVGRQLVLSNGYSFQLDLPKDTICMLAEQKLCTFHHGSSKISCMRRLLDEGFAPFPYKVAKSLHSHFYRNVDLDLYHEMLQSYERTGYLCYDYGNNLQVGDKCVVSMAIGDFDCYIQRIHLPTRSCIVYIVYYCQMVEVSLCTVRASPLYEFQQWPVPAVRMQ